VLVVAYPCFGGWRPHAPVVAFVRQCCEAILPTLEPWQFDRDVLFRLAALVSGVHVLLGYRASRTPSPSSPGVRPGRAALAVAGMGLVCALVCAVQILPSWEYARNSLRAVAEGPRSTYAFSFHPFRLLEYLVPNSSGRQFPVNTYWITTQLPKAEIWTPTTYMGLATLVLAGVALGRCRRRVVAWLAVMGAVSLVAALGQHANLYPILYTGLPGFGSFRYPAKLLVLLSLCLAGLAAFGWDDLFGRRGFGRSRPGWRTRWGPAVTVLAGLALLGLAGIVALSLWGGPFQQWLKQAGASASIYGPLDVPGTVRLLRASFVQVFVVGTLLALACLVGRRRGRWITPVAWVWLGVTAVDLYLANGWIVMTDRQEHYDRLPHVVEVIRRHEAEHGTGQPYRVHRTSIYNPQKFHRTDSPDRAQEVFRWEHQTIQPKYGISFGVSYVHTVGTISLYDYSFFFGPFFVPGGGVTLRDGRQVKVVYHPRLAFDLWNAKYFVLPRVMVLDHEYRGTAAMVADREGKPLPVLYRTPDDPTFQDDDYQVLLNTEAFPRAWLAHRVRVIRPIRTTSKLERRDLMEALTYKGDRVWRSPGRRPVDYHQQVWIEHDDPARIAPFQGPTPADAPQGERVAVRSHEPTRVVIEAAVQQPGVLVVADVFYPGWQARVDGQRVEILRANRMMRGIGLLPGRHVVEFVYDPMSFRIGLMVSLVSLGAVALMGVVLVLRRRRPAR